MSHHWFLDDAPPRREADIRQVRVLNAFRYNVRGVLRMHSAMGRTYAVVFTYRAALHPALTAEESQDDEGEETVFK